MKISTSAMAAVGLLSICAAMSACSSAESDWAKASGANTVAAYQGFLATHPTDSHAAEARTMVMQLQDNAAWEDAQNSRTSAAYQSYLQQFPQGSHASEASGTMATMARAAAWKTAQDTGSAEGFQAFLQKYPTGSEADDAKAKLKVLTGYRIHVASESTDAKAQKKLAELKSRLGEQAPNLQVTADASGKSYSVDSVGMTAQQANDACAAVKKKRETCQVVTQ